MSMTFSTALLAVTKSGDIISDPSPVDAKTASSLHVLAFSPKGHLLLNESQGRFDFDTWESVRERACSSCRGAVITGSDGDIAMGEEGEDSRTEDFIRETVEDHLHRDYAWKIDSA
jgi:exosome complex component RRP46